MWRRGIVVSTRVNAKSCRHSLALVRYAADLASRVRRAPISNLPPAGREIGAGEGNRTLVVSLEGFCSTIELHPLDRGHCHCRAEGVNRLGRLTAHKRLHYHAIRMTHLNAFAATSTAHLWWRGETFAARWRD